MNILIVAATSFEMYDFKDYVSLHQAELAERELYFHFLVTGVGMMHTTYALTAFLNQQEVDVAIQIGVAGSFRHGVQIGDLVQVVSEAMGDMGAEDGEEKLDLFEMNLWEKNAFPFDNKLLFATDNFPLKIAQELRKVHGITVNMVAGVSATIEGRRKKFAADVESMEGGAFHYVCLQMNIPFIQIRCISNYVEPRNTARWKMKDAIEKLNNYMIEKLG